MDSVEFFALAQEQINFLHDATGLREKNIGEGRDLPELRFLGELLQSKIEVTAHQHLSAMPENSNTFYFDSPANRFHLSEGFVKQWLRLIEDLNLRDAKVSAALRAFFLHEFFHVNQKLTSPRHDDARLALTATYSVDYYADMSAALAAFYLDSNQTGKWQQRFADALEGVWLAMAVFQHPLNSARVQLLRFKRYFLAHYQYHRILHHRGKEPTKAQLLYLPAVDFYGLRSGDDITEEKLIGAFAASGETLMWLVAPDGNGMPRLIRSKTTKNRVEALARGIFNGNLQSSYIYFEPLFQEENYLLGGLRGDQPERPISPRLARSIE